MRFLAMLSRVFRRNDGETARLLILRAIGRFVLPAYRFKWPQLGWWYDEQFNEYLDKFDEIGGFNTDRRWMLGQLLRLVEAVPGDTAECGVYKGAGSYLICAMNQANRFHSRWHFAFDSFEGLSAPADVDGKHWEKGDLRCGMEEVKANLSAFEHQSLHKGWIPERFTDIDDRRFAFVHVDVDLYQPTRDSVEFLYPRMNAGGIVVCDDYGCTTCPGATKAIDEFLSNKPEKMLTLSCGGGFLIKGCQTAHPLTARRL